MQRIMVSVTDLSLLRVRGVNNSTVLFLKLASVHARNLDHLSLEGKDGIICAQCILPLFYICF